ncbi:hypothetical protein G7046_g8963 [Stylonectria norvegica]|nr:hypothetical protein G7046_g8963 [Stylonectria norvegica]
MDIASMLNGSVISGVAESTREQPTTPSAVQGGFSASSSVVPTPSPEWIPSQPAIEFNDNRARTPWDAGGYSLPLTSGAKFPTRCAFPIRSHSEHIDSGFSYHAPSAESRSRHGSMESPFASGFSTPLASSRTGRSSTWPEYASGVAAGASTPLSHKLSDSRSSLSSYGSSSSFSGCHSRLSSMSTVSSVHPVSSMAWDIPTLETKLEYLTHSTFRPVLADGPPSDARLANLPSWMDSRRPVSPSDAAPDLRGVKRKRSCLSEDQRLGCPTITAGGLMGQLSSLLRPAHLARPPYLRSPARQLFYNGDYASWLVVFHVASLQRLQYRYLQVGAQAAAQGLPPRTSVNRTKSGVLNQIRYATRYYDHGGEGLPSV